MIDVKALQGQAKLLVDDLRIETAKDADLHASLKKEYAAAKTAERTGGTFESWLEDVIDQAASAWVLACVFVRFCEDNGLVEKVWIGGPRDSDSTEHASTEHAMQARQAYLIENPLRNDRHWLREAFGYLGKLNPTKRLFDEHSPVWRFAISGEAAEQLSDFFRRGAGLASLETENLNTRFLGDIYQDLSAYARAKYALLQTPEFVEEFILDRAFEPALAEFGLPKMSVIDPTCGSGHFLIGAFHRIVDAWKKREPATDVRELVQRSLHQVTGVDVNAFVVAIARFRLILAAMNACGLTSLERAPQFDVRVATGDSLLPWGEPGKAIEQGKLSFDADHEMFSFQHEDEDLLPEYLRRSQYTVVVGNPPYITVKDPTANQRYRELYPDVCYRQYALTVPFAQRFFQLARRGDHDGDGAGWVGEITSNSFMKREFGKRLINEYFAHQVELDEIIDTSGAYIPGHGTPTVILVGRNRLVSGRYSGAIRTVLGIRGEPSQPADPSHGLVWTAITKQINKDGSESEWVSVGDADRKALATHPWSLSGGGASAVLGQIQSVPRQLNSLVDPPIGRAIRAGADEAFARPARIKLRTVADQRALRAVLAGEAVRDWGSRSGEVIWYPYDSHLDHDGLAGELWQWRTFLASRRTFQGSMADAGLHWWEYMQHTASAYTTPLSIAFAEVATHNHFVLDRGGKVFKQTAPVIKLPEGATEDDHLRLLGVLNSSTACFWLKQVSHNKGSTVDQHGARQTTVAWESFYQFNATKLQPFPLPSTYPLDLSQQLDGLAQHLAAASPAAVAASGVPTRERLAAARSEYESIRAQMIALQEELDWQVYRLYGLIDDAMTVKKPPEISLGERAFEIVLARKVAAGEADTQWFARHGSTPITELPDHWPAEYKALVQQRIAVIESDRNIGLIERPECKRRWSTDGWDAMQAAALRDWLLDRLESTDLWGADPTPLSVAQIADRVRHDDDFRTVLDLWVSTDQHDVTKSIGKLVADEHVPCLAAARYKQPGLRKRVQWERTWALQRLEDAGEKVEIAVPPKYTLADFAKTSYWRNRGKLDVAKERFISYPRMGRDGDGSELLGWAGWDHLAQARALAAVYLDRKTQGGWPRGRLLPILAALMEIEPWLHQWHGEPAEGFPGTPADFFSGLLDTELAALGADRSDLATLRGVEHIDPTTLKR